MRHGAEYTESAFHGFFVKRWTLAVAFLLPVLLFTGQFALGQSVEAEEGFLKGLKQYQGQSVKQDYLEAVKNFRKAASAGSSSAQCYLGHMYQHGLEKGADPNALDRDAKSPLMGANSQVTKLEKSE